MGVSDADTPSSQQRRHAATHGVDSLVEMARLGRVGHMQQQHPQVALKARNRVTDVASAP